MIPKDEVIYLSSKKSLEENLAIVKEQMRSRYPLVEGSPDQYIGVLYAAEILANIKELQQNSVTLEELSRDNLTVPQDMPVSELIDFFQQEHQELVMVTKDEKIVGLVTITDALEVIVGSAEDPMDLELRLKR